MILSRLPDQHHLPGADKVARFEAINVNTASQVAGIEHDIMGAGLLAFIDQHCDTLAEDVKDCQLNIGIHGQVVADLRGRIERIGIVLVQGKDCGEGFGIIGGCLRFPEGIGCEPGIEADI